MSKLYLMCGASGSGKTTFAREFALLHNLHYLGIDDFYALVNGSETVHAHENDVWLMFYKAINLAMDDGHDVIVDTNAPTRSQRAEILNWFGKFDEKHLIYMDTPFQVCCIRNQMRKRVVPDDEFLHMFNSMEFPYSSSEDTRWDSITRYIYKDRDYEKEIIRPHKG